MKYEFRHNIVQFYLLQRESNFLPQIRGECELEQLERLRSEDTLHRLMITHTIESYWIPSQKKTKSKLQI